MDILDILKKNEYLFWMNILNFQKTNHFLNKYFGFSLPASRPVSNSSEIIQGSLVGPISVHFSFKLEKKTKGN